MKFFLLLTLSAFVAYAHADISKFQGQVFKKADSDQCLSQYDLITKRVDAAEGLRVLSGGCLKYGRDHVRLQFDYLHPLSTRIENHNVILKDEATCKKFVTQAQNDLAASGNHFVASYCEGKELSAYFVDTTRSVVRTLNKLGNYPTLAQCSALLDDLTAKAKAHKMTSFLSFCKEEKDYKGNLFYSPIFTYTSFYEIEMGLINGKSIASQNACLSDRMSIEQDFSRNDITIVYAFCPRANSTEESLQENILYLKPKGAKYIAEYSGLAMDSQEVCEAQLTSIIQGLESAQEQVLYGYCKNVGTSLFKPAITYIKTIKL